MKKTKFLSAILTTAMIAANIGTVPAVYAAANSATKSFYEDFDGYNITEVMGTDSYGAKNKVSNGAPIDGDYSNLSVYPNGTASVYEGNAANNLFVYDAKGNKINGGLPGWYGAYNGENSDYNQWNRRLAVAKSGRRNDEINNTQYLKMEPHKNSSASAYLMRTNLNFDGYSKLSTRISFPTDGGKINKVGISLGQNSTNNVYDIVTFTDDAATDTYINVNFAGRTWASLPPSKSSGAAKDWYTIEYRVYRNGQDARHSFYMVNDTTGAVVANSGWVEMDLSGSTFTWDDSKSFDVKFYANSLKSVAQPRIYWDDISFSKGDYEEDFEGFNVYIKGMFSGVVGNISNWLKNGPSGNKNITDVYENGAFEGNIQRNNFTYRTVGTPESPVLEQIHGKVPFWQGYVSYPTSNNFQMRSNKYSLRNNIVNTKDVDFGYSTNAIYMSTKVEANYPGIAYAGREQADFADGAKTVFSTDLAFTANKNGTFKVQLTKGRSITTANGATESYKGNSFAETFDIVRFVGNDIYLGSTDTKLNTDDVKDTWGGTKVNIYTLEYTVDRTGDTPKHAIRITNSNNGEPVVVVDYPLTSMNAGTLFDDNIVGFRYISDSTTAQEQVVIDNVSVKTVEVGAKITGAEINIDATNTIKNIAPQMYGINMEWGGQGIAYMKDGELNPEFIDALEGVMPIARMAGSSANSMYWKKAIGALEDRENLQFWHYDAAPLEYGPVEWIQSVKQMNDDAKFIWTVNMPRTDKTTGKVIGETIEDIKDLVRFMTLNPEDENAVGSDGTNWAQKRIDLGIKNPVDIYAWELGNELDASGNGGYTKDEYIEICMPVVEAIVSVNPNAKIALQTATNFDSAGNWRNWHKDAINALFDYYDNIGYISAHFYYDVEQMRYADTVATSIADDIMEVTGEDSIKVILSEHAAARKSDNATGNSYNYCLPHTMKGVISTAEYFNRMMRHENVVASTYHSIYSSSWCTVYPDAEGSLHRTAIADLLEMYVNNAVGEAVECTFDGYADKKNAEVTVGAVKTEAGLNIMLTNDNTFAINTDINITADKNYVLKEKTVITADSYDADNYVDKNEISYTKTSVNGTLTNYTIPARSVVVLSLSEVVDATSVEIVRADANSVSYKLSVAEADEGQATVICAVYNEDGLVAVEIDPVTLSAGIVSKTIDVDTSAGNKVNLMLFDNLTGIEPVCQNYVLSK